MQGGGETTGDAITQRISTSAALATVAALAWMGLIFALSSRRTIPQPFGLASELTSIAGHFTVYAVLAILLWWAIDPLDGSPRCRFALALAGAVAYGLSDEWHQSFVPGRDASLFDIVVDGIGACCGLGVTRIPSRSRGTPVEG